MRRYLFLLSVLASVGTVISVAHAHNAAIAGAGGSGGGLSTTGQLDPVEPSISLSNLVVGSAAKGVVAFRSSSATVRIDRIEVIPAPGASAVIAKDECSGQSLAGGAGCSVSVEVTPSVRGHVEVEIIAHHTGRGSLSRVIMKGNSAGGAERLGGGTDKEVLSDLRGPSEVKFDQAGSAAAIMLTNATDHPISIQTIEIIGGTEAGMNVVSDGCGVGKGQDLSAGASCALGNYHSKTPAVREVYLRQLRKALSQMNMATPGGEG